MVGSRLESQLSENRGSGPNGVLAFRLAFRDKASSLLMEDPSSAVILRHLSVPASLVSQYIFIDTRFFLHVEDLPKRPPAGDHLLTIRL